MLNKITKKFKDEAKKEIKETVEKSIDPKLVAGVIFVGMACLSGFLERKPTVVYYSVTYNYNGSNYQGGRHYEVR